MTLSRFHKPSSKSWRPEPWIPSLDAIRGVAALAVVVGHSGQQVLGSAAYGTPLGAIVWWLGNWGVTLFFVLSGFCIHLPQARRELGGVRATDWRTFFRRRAFRLLPPHYVALALAAVTGMQLQSALITKPTASSVVQHVFMVHPFFGSVAFYSINAVFWSIAVEVHFYILYPVFLWLRRVLDTGRLTLVMCAFSLASYGVSRIALAPEPRFVAQHCFLASWWQWALGAWAAETYVRGRSQFAGLWRTPFSALAYGTASLALAWTDVTVLGLHVKTWILPPLCGVFLLATVTANGHSHRFVALERLGACSYSLYLVHPVALAVLSNVGLKSPLVSVCWLVGGSVALGILFYAAVEKHFVPTRTSSVRQTARATN